MPLTELPPPGIFKAYDIRGLHGTEMDEETAYLIGRAFARVLAGLRGKQPDELLISVEVPALGGACA